MTDLETSPASVEAATIAAERFRHWEQLFGREGAVGELSDIIEQQTQCGRLRECLEALAEEFSRVCAWVRQALKDGQREQVLEALRLIDRQNHALLESRQTLKETKTAEVSSRSPRPLV